MLKSSRRSHSFLDASLTFGVPQEVGHLLCPIKEGYLPAEKLALDLGGVFLIRGHSQVKDRGQVGQINPGCRQVAPKFTSAIRLLTLILCVHTAHSQVQTHMHTSG